MFTTAKRTTRPSTDVKFFNPGQEFIDYVTKNYIDAGKILSVSRELTPDGLTLTSTTIWKDKETFLEYGDDLYCAEISSRVKEYEYENNFVVGISLDGGEFSKSSRVWKKYNSAEYFSNITIPDDWATLEDFVDWYMEQRIPLMIPWDSEVIRSDDAVAICIFRKGHYQVEFYLEYPNMYILPHSHPRMEVITMNLGGGKLGPQDTNGLAMSWGRAHEKLPAGEIHGGEEITTLSKGFITLAFQRWEDPAEMTSAAVQWKGGLQGPYQADLIRRKKKNAIVADDYADVSGDTTVDLLA